jgi:uncharacterized membrane protein
MNDVPHSDPSGQPAGSPPPPVSPGGSGLQENVAGALSYLLGPITGVAFYVMDRQRAFVRFHAIQSIGLTITWVALAVLLMIVSAVLGVIPIIGWIVSILLNLGLAVAGFGLWLWLMYQAYQGRTWEIPGLGPHVRRIAAETGGDAPPAA